MKHVLLPTDFSIRSLQPVHAVMQYCTDEPVRITLLHLLEMPTATGDLLFRLSQGTRQVRIPDEFLRACELLSNRYADRLLPLKPLIRYGGTVAFTENLLQGLEADWVFLQKEAPFCKPHPSSADTPGLLRQCRVPVVEIEPGLQPEALPAGGVGDLLLASQL